MALGDPESLPRALEKATRYASDGLELLARENALALEEGLRRVPLERLFRVGINLDRDAALPAPIDDDDEHGMPSHPDETEPDEPS